MTQSPPGPDREAELLAELDRLRQQVTRLERENQDLTIALSTTAEHGDLVESELYEANQRLQGEIAERERAQGTLQEILERVSRDKADLELILEATTAHGDAVEYQLYTQAVEAMRQSEDLFRTLAESTPVLMILTQKFDGAITYANAVSGDRLGVETRRLLGQSLRDFFASDADEEAILEKLIRQGKVENYEMQIRSLGGDRFWVSASMHPVELGGKQVVLVTLFDISDRKAAEDALRRSQSQLQDQARELEQRVEQRTLELRRAEEKYRSIYENAAEGIFQTTPEGRYLDVNPALARLYGYDSPEALIAAMDDIGQKLYVRPRRRDELLAYLQSHGSLSDFESQVYRKDGSIIWISENMRAVRDREGKVLYYEGSVLDVTERREAEAELREQKANAERLLLNVLPPEIAERLKRRQTTIADRFSEATVLFADLVGFTELCARTPPDEIVNLLNAIFSAFDGLAERYRLEKIKTLGDAYMLAGGLPTPHPDHLDAAADAAIAMLDTIRQFRAPGGQPLELRIGLHVGPVVAGVIGQHRFIYDLWGDTVNVASRMESRGAPGRIQTTVRVYERLKRRYDFQKRGRVEVKGKGAMLTYWLLGRRDPLRDRAAGRHPLPELPPEPLPPDCP